MKKRWLAALLCVCCISGSLTIGMSNNMASSTMVTASAAETEKTLEGLKDNLTLMGIMDSSLTEASYNTRVTRKEFAKLLVKASVYSDTAGSDSGSASYSDLSSKSEYAVFVKTAVDNGWMTGYLNGKFKPNAGIQTKDAAKAVLTMLGYSNSDFTGNKVNSRMTKFNSLGLNDNINKTKNDYLTWKDIIYLFDNLMGTKTKEGNYYGKTLGYTVDADGNIDVNSLLTKTMDGPILVLPGWSYQIPVTAATATVYRNEKEGIWNEINYYDVLYYSENLNTVWVYDNKVTGKVTEISPNRVSPEAVTVAGNTYTLGTQEAARLFSLQGEYGINETVTLFLGIDEEVVSARNASEYNAGMYGVVLETGTRSNTSDSSDAILEDYLVLMDVKGRKSTYTYNSEAYSIEENDVIEVSFSSHGTQKIEEMSYVSDYNLNGKEVNSTGTEVGGYKISPSAAIIDIYGNEYETLAPEELAGVTLNSENVLYFSCTIAGTIDEMILTGVSGCGYEYGLVTGVEDGEKDTNCVYQTKNGSKSVSFENISGDVTDGEVYRITDYDDSDILDFTQLTKEKVYQLSSTFIETYSYKGAFYNDTLIYYVDEEGSYYATSLSKINNLEKYNIVAYMEDSETMIKRIRFLVAEDISS